MEEPQLVEFADFCVVNNPTMADCGVAEHYFIEHRLGKMSTNGPTPEHDHIEDIVL